MSNISKTKNDDFKFHCPLNIYKGKNSDGKEVMKLGGVASTQDKDTDGEFLDPSGFQIDDFLKVGFVNWHHLPSEKPTTIIGEPSKAQIKKDGFHVEVELYPSSSMAQEVYELAETLNKDSTTRKLGFSIEGSVLERANENKNHPDYQIVKKANITGLAITHMPKNNKTFAEIIKGCKDEKLSNKDNDEELSNKDEDPCWDGYEQVGMKEKDGKQVPNCVKKDNDEDSEKSLSTTSGAALTRESLDGVNNGEKKDPKENLDVQKSNYFIPEFSFEEQFDLIFDAYPAITIEKSDKLNDFLNKTREIMSKKGNNVTDDQLEKAFNQLGFEDLDTNPFLEKATKSKMTSEEAAKKVQDETISDDEEDVKQYNKYINKKDDKKSEKSKSYKKSEDGEEMDDEEETEKGKMKKSQEKDFGKGAVLVLKKAIENQGKENFEHSKALATLVKAGMDRNNELKQENEELKKSIQNLSDKVDEYKQGFNDYLSQPNAPKSMRKARPVEKESFQKSQPDEKQLSQSQNFNQVLNLLDNAAFSKGGYDEHFAKATTSFESSKVLPNDVKTRIRNEFGISIVD